MKSAGAAPHLPLRGEVGDRRLGRRAQERVDALLGGHGEPLDTEGGEVRVQSCQRGVWSRHELLVVDHGGGHDGAGARNAAVVRLVDRRPFCVRHVVRVDHHRVGDGEGLAVHDDAGGRVEQLDPLRGDEGHARVFCHPRTLGVEFCHDALRLRRRVHLGRRLVGIEAVRHPVGQSVARRGRIHARSQPLLVEADHVGALPVFERIGWVQQHLLARAAVGAQHHGQVCDDRRARVVHPEDEDLRRRSSGPRRRGTERERRYSSQHRSQLTCARAKLCQNSARKPSRRAVRCARRSPRCGRGCAGRRGAAGRRPAPARRARASRALPYYFRQPACLAEKTLSSAVLGRRAVSSGLACS